MQIRGWLGVSRDGFRTLLFAWSIFLLSIGSSFVFAAADTPMGPEKIFAFAESLFTEGDYFRAITEYKRVVFHFPDHRTVETCRFRIAECYHQAGRWAEAASSFQDFLALYPQSPQAPRARYLKGLAEKEMKRFEEAGNSFDELLQDKHSDYADKAAYQKAMILIDQEEWRKAAAAFRLVPERSPLHTKARKTADGLEKIDTVPQKSPGAAGLMAAILPGSGHLYVERPKDAAAAFFLNAAFIAAAVELFRKDNNVLGGIVTFFELGWYFGNIYSAVSSAHKYNKKKRDEYLLRLKEDGAISFYYNPQTASGNMAVSVRF